MQDVKTLDLGNHVTVDLLVNEEGEWGGLAGICAGEIPLRSADLPMTVRMQTPEGILYTRYVLHDIHAEADGTHVLAFDASGMPWGVQDYLDEYQQPMVTVALPQQPVEDRLWLELRPRTLTLGGRDWVGFSYLFRFKSQARRLHRLTVRGSWEIGGAISGNTVLSQGQCNMPVYRGASGTLFTTSCLKTLDRYGSPQGVSYQLGPRGGLIQAFDFQYGRDGALLQFWPQFGSISSILESPVGSDVLHVIDEHRFELAREANSFEQYVLFAPGDLPENEARNVWYEAYEYVYGRIRSEYDIKPSVVRTECGTSAFPVRIQSGDRVQVRVVGEWVDAQEMLHATADRILPRLAEAGVRRYFPLDAHETDVTVLGLVRKLDSGVHGDHECASVCSSHRFFPSEFWGGISGWRYLADKARELGIEIGCWFAPHFSPRAAVFKEHPEWLLTGPDSLPWGGGYRSAIVTADWNTAVYDWVLDDFKRWAEEGGLDYIFVDSWANMGLVQYNCAANMRTNWKALARLLGDIQKRGIKAYSFESVAPLGVSRFGVTDLRGDLLDATQGVVGQNDFGWWADELDMTYNLAFHAHLRKRSDAEQGRLLFGMLANRGSILADIFMDDDMRLPEWCRDLYATYEQVLPSMQRRELLPHRQGVRWHAPGEQILWAQRDMRVPVTAAATVWEIQAGRPQQVSLDDHVLQAREGRVYRIGK